MRHVGKGQVVSDYIFGYYLLLLTHTFLTLICHFFSDRSKKILSGVFLFAFSLFIAMRPLDSPDTRAYEYAFVHSRYLVKLITANNLLVKIYGMETGYILIMFILNKIMNFRLFLFCSSLFVLYFSTEYLYRISKALLPDSTVAKIFIDYTFVVIFGGYYAGAAMRSGIIMTLCIMAFYLLIKRKYVFSFVIVIGSCLIQRSAVIFIVIFLAYIFCQKMDKKIVTLCIILFSIGAIFNNKLQLINFSDLVTKLLKNTPISSYSKFLVKNQGSMGTVVVATFILIIMTVILCEGFERLYPILAIIPFVYLCLPTIASSKRLTDMFLIFIVPVVATKLSKFGIIDYAYKIRLSILFLFSNLLILMIGNCRLFLY